MRPWVSHVFIGRLEILKLLELSRQAAELFCESSNYTFVYAYIFSVLKKLD